MVTSQSPRLPPKPRRPLHERCKVTLAIMPISYRDWNKVYDCNCDLVLVFEDEEEVEEKKNDQPHHHPPPSLIEDCHLVEIMGGLYIALADDEADVSALRTFDDKLFTHVVQVSYPAASVADDPLAMSNWGREEAPRNALVQRLGLVCPPASLRLCAEQTAVGPGELRAARDFLSLALPHGSTKWWPRNVRKDEQDREGEQGERGAREEHDADEDDEASVQVVTLAPNCGLDDLLNEHTDQVKQDDDINVLIVAPTGRAVDVLSVLFCYLAFLEDVAPEDLMDTDYCGEVWGKVALGPWSMLYVELIARCN